MNAAALLEIRDLVVVFEQRGRTLPVLDGVNLTVAPGQSVGVLGESGAGKTMTALAVLRLLPDGARITGGRLAFDGRDLIGLNSAELCRLRGREVGMAFQDPLTAFDPIQRIGRQILEAIRVHRRVNGRAEARRRVLELLERAGLDHPETIVSRFPHELSGGMRGRVMAAMAMSADPRLLIADEPTAALDPAVRETVLEWFDQARQSRGMGLVLISHQVSVLRRHTERVVVIHAGRTVEEGPTRQVFDHPLHPYTRALLASSDIARVGFRLPLPEMGVDAGEAAPDASGCRFAARCPHARPLCRRHHPPLIAAGEGVRVGCWMFEEGGSWHELTPSS